MSKVTKKQLQEDIKSLESGIAMNWSDMKKIEVRLSRAMTDMATRISNISLQLEGQQRQIHLAADSIGLNKQAIIMLENEREAEAEPEPQLKQLDQSIFDGLDEKWRFAMVSSVGIPFVYDYKPTGKRHFLSDSSAQLMVSLGKVMRIDEYDYDASNWQNSLIERDIAKELLEVDLSSELTGSDLALELLKNQRYIIASVSDVSDADAIECGNNKLIHKSSEDIFTDDMGGIYCWAVALNNQGELLTQAEVGL